MYPFRERDVGVFFGRQDLTERLVTEVTRRPLVAVVGPSGSGKSSVVFAGVVPQMVQKEGWMSISVRPAQASSPLFALAAALLPVLDPDQAETERLTALDRLASLLLVRPSDVEEPVRRIARRPELGEPRWQLGQRLAATRLLVADRDPTGVESVELVHEALIGGWSRLHEWVDDDRIFRIWQERLRGAVAEWETVRRDPGALLRGAPACGGGTVAIQLVRL